MREPSSGTLRSRLITPSSDLTNKKIDAYALAGRYGIFMQQKMRESLKQKKKGKKKKSLPTTSKLHKNSLAFRSLETLL